MKKTIKNTIKRTLFTLFIALCAGAQADDYTAEIDYVVLDKPVKTTTGDKVEVRELFWYYCPHCFRIGPLVKNWLKKIPNTAEFVHQPAVLSERWVNGAIFYYVLEGLGEVDRLHDALFDAIHVHKTQFLDQADFVDWLVDNGVDEKRANDAFKSFSVRVKVNQSKVNTTKYKISGVPTFIVNGKYWVDAKQAGGQARLFKVIDYLIEKESKVGK